MYRWSYTFFSCLTVTENNINDILLYSNRWIGLVYITIKCDMLINFDVFSENNWKLTQKINRYDFTGNRLCLGFVIMCLNINLAWEICQDLLPSMSKNISLKSFLRTEPK